MDFYRFWQILEDRNHPDMQRHYRGPEDNHDEPPTISEEKEFETRIVLSDGAFVDADNGKRLGLEQYAKHSSPGKEYTLRVGLVVSMKTFWNGRTDRLEPNGVDLDVEWARLEEGELGGLGLHEDDALKLFSLEDEAKNTPYKVYYDLVEDKLQVSVR